MEAYGAGRLVGTVSSRRSPAGVPWAGLQRRKRGENGTPLIAVGTLLAVAFLVTLVQSSL